ncbi:MAG: hypothetical protein GVY15_11415 [Bacteroidetes bacterium]|jgi:hypothetical protein|nr:hypothetical protein [Bacteroidota bacterium]
MTHYEHTQVGHTTGGALLAGAGLALLSPMGWAKAALAGSLGVGAALFASLTVRVTDRALHFYFGPGFWKKRIPLDEIAAVRAVRNSPWYGWGIRLTPHGWLYNVSGLDAVEIEKTDGTTLRIGTDEPTTLAAALTRARQPS